MRRTGACCTLLPALAVCSMAARAETLAITGATIIDGTGRAPVTNGVLVITDGRISAVGSLGSVAISSTARRIDARGKYVIPGLMDANMALFSTGNNLDTLANYDGRYHELILEAAQV